MSKSIADADTTAAAADASDQLTELGYTAEFRREMSPWANFSLGFTYLSPVVGTYTLFAIAMAQGGPSMIWSFLVAGAGQFLVALVFSEVVAQYPIAGGVYPWARRLWGQRWAWMSGWVYLVALLVTIAAVAYGAGPYLAVMAGFEASLHATVACAIVIIVLATLINFAGTRVLSIAAIFGFAAELVGALIVGFWLLFTERYHGLGVLFDDFGTAGGGSYLPAFLAAGIIGLYQYYGFEACGDTAEEVADPGRTIPKAMRRTIYIGGSAATFACLTLVLAVPNYGAVISGENADPVGNILASAFGDFGARVVMGVVLISFLSCTMSLQAAAGRLSYAYGRDQMIVGHRFLARFSEKLHIPPYALLAAGVIPALITIGSLVSTEAVIKLTSFAILGIYLAFQMVVLAALRARLKGWQPSGKYRLGRYGLLVNVAALVYGVAAMVNICWPRTPGVPWYDNYIVLLCGVAVVAIGLLYMVTTRHYGRSDAQAGDAIPISQR